jgi:alpha-D-ribose 1-methylphosphonate 5-triphosphate synthase subunit PhnI
MGYVAVKGGEKAILNSEELLVAKTFGHESEPIEVHQILEQFALAVDRVMGEGGLYWPKLAAYALKQALGDSFEAAFLVRAFRSSVPRRGYTDPIDTRKMRVHRRISAAFKDVPGGQILGATPDYGLRFIRFDLFENLHQARIRAKKALENLARAGIPIPDSFPKIVDILREQGLLVSPPSAPRILTDITMETVSIPTSRSARLQFLARGETGGLLALAYSSMRGYGQIHPAIGELRVGDVPVYLEGKPLGWIRVTECEVISRMERGEDQDDPHFTMGYGLCFGQNELKAISMAVLDRTMQMDVCESPAQDQEFVLLHTDGIEAMGFCLHYKLPHYVTFQADLNQLRGVRRQKG